MRDPKAEPPTRAQCERARAVPGRQRIENENLRLLRNLESSATGYSNARVLGRRINYHPEPMVHQPRRGVCRTRVPWRSAPGRK